MGFFCGAQNILPVVPSILELAVLTNSSDTLNLSLSSAVNYPRLQGCVKFSQLCKSSTIFTFRVRYYYGSRLNRASLWTGCWLGFSKTTILILTHPLLVSFGALSHLPLCWQ